MGITTTVLLPDCPRVMAYTKNSEDQTHYYPLKQKVSDEKLREQARNRALLQAAAEGQTIRTNKLLKDGADVDYIDKYGWTALHHAAYSGFDDTTKALLAAGADVNARSEHFGTPLALAALKGRIHVTETLLTSRASAKTPCGKLGSVLHASCAGGNVEVVKKVRDHGADIDKLAEFDKIIIDLLLGTQDVGNYLNFEEALARASEDSRESSSDWEDRMVPLEYDADITMPEMYRTTALNIAALYGKLEPVKVLLSPYIGSDMKRYVESISAVVLYLSAFGEEYLLEELIEFCDALGVVEGCGSLFIGAAAYAGNHECLQHLLGRGASPYPRHPQGMTALLWAARNGHAKCIELLMEYEDPDKNMTHFQSHAATPIMDAAAHGRLDCVKVLLRHGASLEPLQNPGRNALHCAVDSGNVVIIEELVKAGIDINSLDEHGWTPLMCSLYVQEWGWGEIFRPRRYLVEKLISLEADPSINNIAQVFKDKDWEDAIPWLKKK